MSLNDLANADNSTVFFNTNDFAESAYVSRNSATVTLTLIVDTQQVQTVGNNDITITRNWLILLIEANKYNFGNGVVEPMPIDEFVVGNRRFEPRKPDGMGQCWEYTDGTSQILKIFVEEVT